MSSQQHNRTLHRNYQHSDVLTINNVKSPHKRIVATLIVHRITEKMCVDAIHDFKYEGHLKVTTST